MSASGIMTNTILTARYGKARYSFLNLSLIFFFILVLCFRYDNFRFVDKYAYAVVVVPFVNRIDVKVFVGIGVDLYLIIVTFI